MFALSKCLCFYTVDNSESFVNAPDGRGAEGQTSPAYWPVSKENIFNLGRTLASSGGSQSYVCLFASSNMWFQLLRLSFIWSDQVWKGSIFVQHKDERPLHLSQDPLDGPSLQTAGCQCPVRPLRSSTGDRRFTWGVAFPSSITFASWSWMVGKCLRCCALVERVVWFFISWISGEGEVSPHGSVIR